MNLLCMFMQILMNVKCLVHVFKQTALMKLVTILVDTVILDTAGQKEMDQMDHKMIAVSIKERVN